MKEQDVLQVFQTMVIDSRGRLREDSFYYLMWGWLVVLACALEIGLMAGGVSWHWAVWPVLMPIGGVVSGVRGMRMGAKKQHQTALDRMMGALWGGWLVTLVILLLGAPRMGWDVTYALLMALYGLGTFVSGAMLRFKPLMWGGAGAWLLSAVTLFLPGLDFSMVLVLLGLSIVVSYLIPGYMLKYSAD